VVTQLLALARRQAGLIAEGDMTSLLQILAGKQQLVSELQKLDRQLAPHLQTPPEARHWSSASERTRCQAQAARCEAVLREILLVEQQAEQHMTQERANVEQRLATFQQSAQAARAYLPSMPVQSSGMLDVRE
jgi:hypothetical protein